MQSTTVYSRAPRMICMKSSLAKRINQVLEETGITKADLARAAKVSPTAVGQWTSGQVLNLNYKNAERIAKRFGYSTEWLMDGSGQEKTRRALGHEASESRLSIVEWEQDESLSSDSVMLDVIDIELSAGPGMSVSEEKPSYKLPFMRETLRANGVRAADAKIVRIIGNSMSPVMENGDTVGVNTADRYPIRDGKPYAIRDMDLIRVKLLYALPGGGLRVRSFNQAEFPDETLTGSEVEDRITVIGRVFWSSKMW